MSKSATTPPRQSNSRPRATHSTSHEWSGLAKSLPVIYQDDQATYMWEINNKLRGVVPLNVIESNDPENYYFVK